MLTTITRSPWLQMVAGIILLITAGNEIWTSIDEFSLGAHHGVAVFGLFQIVKSIPEILHGLNELQEGEDKLR